MWVAIYQSEKQSINWFWECYLSINVMFTERDLLFIKSQRSEKNEVKIDQSSSCGRVSSLLCPLFLPPFFSLHFPVPGHSGDQSVEKSSSLSKKKLSERGRNSSSSLFICFAMLEQNHGVAFVLYMCINSFQLESECAHMHVMSYFPGVLPFSCFPAHGLYSMFK